MVQPQGSDVDVAQAGPNLGAPRPPGANVFDRYSFPGSQLTSEQLETLKSYGGFKRADFGGQLQATFSPSTFGARAMFNTKFNLIPSLDPVGEIFIALSRFQEHDSVMVAVHSGTGDGEKWTILGKYRVAHRLVIEDGEYDRANPEAQARALAVFHNLAKNDQHKGYRTSLQWRFGKKYLMLSGEDLEKAKLENRLRKASPASDLCCTLYAFESVLVEDEISYYK